MVSRFTIGRIKRAERKAARKIDKYERKGIHLSSKQSPINHFKKETEQEARQY